LIGNLRFRHLFGLNHGDVVAEIQGDEIRIAIVLVLLNVGMGPLAPGYMRWLASCAMTKTSS
jgi:hypothetical protein